MPYSWKGDVVFLWSIATYYLLPAQWSVSHCESVNECAVTRTIYFDDDSKEKYKLNSCHQKRTPLVNAKFYSDTVVGISVEIFQKCGCRFKILGTRRITWSECHIWRHRTKFSRHGNMTPRFVYPWSRDLFLDIQQTVFRNLKLSNRFWWRLQYPGTLRCVVS
jgi:hypothetical protein